MGKVTGFLEIDRLEQKYEPTGDRIRHYREFTLPMEARDVEKQASRCMDCGIPYCHTGCPVNNQIPDWNDLVYQSDWQNAAHNLHSTNNFPEFTGRTCPAPCEDACTLYLEGAPVTIKSIENSIVERAWKEGWVQPKPAKVKTGKSVAIIGSGPAGLAAAQQLARAGHNVHVYEREAKAGGLLRYGIPDFKMEKWTIDRRLAQLEAEGVIFYYNMNVGTSVSAQKLVDNHDAVILAIGAEAPRDPQLPGQQLQGVEYAMPYLTQSNKKVSGQGIGDETQIFATGKHVVVIGGGDTASDCVGTAFRQGALAVTQLDIRPVPPKKEDVLTVWPYYPTKMRVSSSQAEGVEREFAVATIAIEGENGVATQIKCARVDAKRQPIAGSEFYIKADLVLLAIGFSGAMTTTFVDALGIEANANGTLKADAKAFSTKHPKVFATGDARRGQSLVVWAIREGRDCAAAVDVALKASV